MSESKSKKSKKTEEAETKKTDASKTQEFKATADKLVERIKNAVQEGNVRKILIKNADGKIVVEIPLTIATVGALLAPYLAALGLFASVLANYTIVVEKKN